MRKLSLVVVAAMVFATGSMYANDISTVKPGKGLRSQISNMLSDNNFTNLDEDHVAQVRFTLNENGEIVVLSVDTEDAALERFVKSKLNYAKVEIANVKEGKLYTVPVRIKA